MFGQVGGLRFGGADVVVWAEDELRSAGAGGDADLVKENRCLVDKDG
jgi:hypothetical protein